MGKRRKNQNRGEDLRMKKLVLLVALAAVMAIATSAFAATSWDVYFSGDVKIFNTTGAVKWSKSLTSPDVAQDVVIPTLLQDEKFSVNGSWFMEARGTKEKVNITGNSWTKTEAEVKKGNLDSLKFLGSSGLAIGKSVFTSKGLSFDLLAVSECSVDIELIYTISEDITHNGEKISSRDLHAGKELELDLAVAKTNSSSGCNTDFSPLIVALFAPLMLVRRKK